MLSALVTSPTYFSSFNPRWTERSTFHVTIRACLSQSFYKWKQICFISAPWAGAKLGTWFRETSKGWSFACTVLYVINTCLSYTFRYVQGGKTAFTSMCVRVDGGIAVAFVHGDG